MRMPDASTPIYLLFAGPDERLADEARAAFSSSPHVDVNFAADAEQAISHATSRSIDAVVVEPRLRLGSGNALLGRFKRDFPQAIRILALESGRDSPALGALENLHRLLYRPIDDEQLLSAIHGVRQLRARMESPILADVIGRIGKLPAPPMLSLELMRKTEDPSVGADEVASLVERDPVLAAKVLRLCNSAMYSGGRVIRDIRTAVVWLGNLTLRRLVLAGEVFGAMRGAQADPEHEILRHRSLNASRLAARLLPGVRSDLAGTAALLAGVGRLLPSHAMYPSTITATPSFADAGAYLLQLWGLPSILVEATALHPTPLLAAESEFGVVGATHVAWALLADLPLDTDYIEQRDLSQHMQRWQMLAQEIREEPEA